MGVRVRYAPSPTGNLHIGSARTVLYNWLFARHHGGTFVLRIEDTDLTRSSEAFVEAQQQTLRWLGLDWDEGPGVGGPHAPYRQTERLHLYREALEALRASGAAYPCYCTPEELAARREEARRAGRAPRYDGRCRDLTERQRQAFEAAGRRPAWRLRVPDEGETVVHDLILGDVRFEHAALDDFVIVRSDGWPVYNFVVVVDDLEMEITHVLRGDDHLANTPKQIQVYRALGKEPPAFGHLPSVLAADRSRLSKRHGPVSIEEYREAGLLPEAILNYCALLGWSPPDGSEILTLEEMVAAFDLDRVHRSGAVYDPVKLRWMNGQHLRRLPAEEVARRAAPWLAKAGLPTPDAAPEAGPPLAAAVALVQERVQTLAEIPDAITYFYRAPAAYDPAGVQRHFRPEAAARLRAAADAVEGLEPFDAARMEAAYRGLAERMGVKAADLIHPTRLALTGRTVGPSLFALAELIGQKECVARLREAARRIEAGEFAA
jgi:nondiscriminating glutamyl-tRNA synthetase